MLHAALIGLPATGKSTLFQLMTSAKEGGTSAKGDTAVGISKVPDQRLDRLTAMFNPRKRVPATIEFTDSAGAARAAASALVDVAGYKNADALVHVVRAFRDAAVAHPSLTIDPPRDAQAMEDELILADLGVVERRMERLEKDLKKAKTAGSREGARHPGPVPRRRWPMASRCARWDWPATTSSGCAASSSSRPSRCWSSSTSTKPTSPSAGDVAAAAARHRPVGVPGPGRRPGRCRSAPRSSSRSPSSSRPTRRRS